MAVVHNYPLTDDAPDLSIVLPAHNEAANVSAIAKHLAEVARPLGSYEVVFVDDGSTDETLAEVLRLAGTDSTIRYVSFTRNFGHQAALRAGLRHARGRAVLIMDCDFEHPPELIPTLFEKWRAGALVVTTQRLDSEASLRPMKRWSSHFFYGLLNAIGDVHISPGSADFLLLDRKVVDTINSLQEHNFFLRGLVRWLGYSIATVPFVQGHRREGASKFTVKRMVDLAVTGIVAHSVKPLRIGIYLSIVFAVLGFLFLVYSIGVYFFASGTVAGWASIMATVAILGSGQLLVLGVVGEYIGRILREVRDMPSYIIAFSDTLKADVGHPRLKGTKQA